MNEERADMLSPGDFWEIIFRHKKKIVLTPVLIILAAAAIILWAPRTYQSEAKLFLQIGRESVGIDPTALTGQTINLQEDGRSAEVISAMSVIGSRGVVAKTVHELGADYILRGGPAGEVGGSGSLIGALTAPLGAMIQMIKDIDPITKEEEAIIELEKAITLDTERDSTVIVIQVDAKSAVGAQEILTKLIEVYREEHLRIHRNPESHTFFTEQRDMLETRLEEANLAVREAKSRMGLASIEGRRSTLENQLMLVEQEAYTTEQNLATSLARITDLKRQLSQMPERMIASRRSIPNQGADLLRESLFALQQRKMDLTARYHDSHPLVVAISAQVEEAEKVVEDQQVQREETTDDVNPNHRALSLELKQEESLMAGFDARLNTLREQKQLILRDLKQLNRYEVELDDLMREVSIARTKFFKYAENLEQARIDQALEDQRISSVSIAQAATLASKPISPSKGLIGLGALLLAFGGSVTWVVAAEQLNDKIRAAEDVEEQLDMPVFAEIPKHKLHGRVLNY